MKLVLMIILFIVIGFVSTRHFKRIGRFKDGYRDDQVWMKLMYFWLWPITIPLEIIYFVIKLPNKI